MSTAPRDPRRPPYWLLVAFAALMLVPASAFPFAVVATLSAGAGLRLLAARGRARAAAAVAEPVPGAIRLGVTAHGAPADLTDAMLAAHGLVLGASGAGKSTSLLHIITNRVARGRPVVAIDLKGSPAFAATLAEAAAGAGRPFRIWTPDGPGHWNPLGIGNPTELKDKLIGGERFTEPHYQRAAERYLQAALTVLQALHPERPPTLAETVAFTEPRRLAGSLRGVPEPLRLRVQDYLDGLSPDAMSAVRGIGTRLALLTESHAGTYLEPGPGVPVEVRGALRGDAVTLFSLNSSRYGALAAQLGTMIVQDLVSAAGERLDGEAGAGALVAIDEFSALGAEQIVRLFARARAAGMSVLVATQELADLDRAAPGLRDQILGNTALKLIHRQDVPTSALAVSRMVGSERVWEETHRFGGTAPRDRFGVRGTRREVERPRVHPDAVMALRTGEAVLITKVPEARAGIVRVRAPAPPRGAERSERERG